MIQTSNDQRIVGVHFESYVLRFPPSPGACWAVPVTGAQRGGIQERSSDDPPPLRAQANPPPPPPARRTSGQQGSTCPSGQEEERLCGAHGGASRIICLRIGGRRDAVSVPKRIPRRPFFRRYAGVRTSSDVLEGPYTVGGGGVNPPLPFQGLGLTGHCTPINKNVASAPSASYTLGDPGRRGGGLSQTPLPPLQTPPPPSNTRPRPGGLTSGTMVRCGVSPGGTWIRPTLWGTCTWCVVLGCLCACM